MSQKILLVEDEALIAMNEAQILKKHGYEVVTAYTGEKAVELVDNDPEISLILMDIDLGNGMDGTEAAEKILSHHELPIVFLTSHSEKEYVEKVKEITAYGYVLKNSGKFVLIESMQMAYTLFDAHTKLETENRARRESEEELSSIYAHTPVLMLLVDKERRVRKANAFAEQFSGTPAEEMIGKRGGEALRCIHHFDDPQGCGFGPFCKECTVKRTLGNTFSNGKEYLKAEATLPFIQDGKKRQLTFLVSTSLLRKEEEDLCLVAFEDITDYKELQEKYKGLFENAPLPYQSLDENGIFLEINPAWLDTLGGYTREEVLGKSFADFLHHDSIDIFRDNLEKLKIAGTAKENMYKMKKKTGEYIDASFNGRIAHTPDGEVKQTHCIFKDVTEKKRAEEAIKESEEKYRLLFNYSNDAIFVHEIGEDNLPGKNIDVNERATALLRYSREELLHMSAKDVVPEKLQPSMYQHAKELMEKKHMVFETENIRSDGVVVPVEVSAYWYKEKGKQFAVASVRDITERKQAEMKLRESEKIFRQMFTKHHAIMLLIDPDTGKIVNANASASKYYGFSVDELCQMTIQQINTMPAKEVAYERTLAAKEKRNHFFFSHRLSNGEIRDVEVHSTLIELAEQKALFSIVHDITARKQADKELRESLSRFDELIAKVSVGVYIVWLLADGRKKFEYVSDRWCSIHKIRREEVIADAATVDEQVHPDEAVAFFERHLEAARDQKPFLWEGRFAIGDGEFRWMRIESNPTVFGNGDIRFFGVTQDITERKRAEGALKESEEKFRTLFNLIPDAALLADAETGQIVKANKASEDLFEIPLDNLTGMNHTELYSEELRKKADVEFKKGPELLSKPFPPLEMIVETPSGIKKTVELRGSALYIDNKLHLLGTFRDITERKKVDKVLTRKATLLEEAQDLAKLGSWEWDIGNDKWYFSDQWKKIHGLSDNDLTTSKLIEIAHPEDAPYIEKAFSEAKEEGKPYNIQHRIIRADNNEIRYIHALGKIEYSQDTGDPVRMVGIAQDITEKTKVENNLREALKEKEFFMKELNHRVKNNLLMVSSLINLKDPETEADFSDIKHQIDAISLIHEKLYQTESVTEISCRDYFGDLLSSIFSSFTTRQIKIKADIDSVSIPTKSAVSLGLIINEIATNAIKYGFTDREEAVFSVTMKEDKENSRYELTLSNTGNPFPENVEVDNPQTLGLRLISALTEQLGGTMDLKRAPHPVFTFRFPVEEE